MLHYTFTEENMIIKLYVNGIPEPLRYEVPETVWTKSNVIKNMIADLGLEQDTSDNDSFELELSLPDNISLDGFEEFINSRNWTRIENVDTLIVACWLEVDIDTEIHYDGHRAFINKPTQRIDFGPEYDFILECWSPSINDEYDKYKRRENEYYHVIRIKAMPRVPVKYDNFEKVSKEIEDLREFAEYPMYHKIGFDIYSFMESNKHLGPEIVQNDNFKIYPSIMIKPRFIINIDPDYRLFDDKLVEVLKQYSRPLLGSYTFVSWAQRICDVNLRSIVEWSTIYNDYTRLMMLITLNSMLLISDKYEFKKVFQNTGDAMLDMCTDDRYKPYKYEVLEHNHKVDYYKPF